MNFGTAQEQSLFDAALQIAEPVKCQAFLDKACAGNDDLRLRINKLLAAHARSERFFAECAATFTLADGTGG